MNPHTKSGAAGFASASNNPTTVSEPNTSHRKMSFVVTHSRRLAAIAVIATLYWQARIPKSSASPAEIAQRFHFDGIPLFSSFTEALIPGLGVQVEQVEGHRYFVRNVHPSFQHIRSWISSVGAAVALSDLDGDGLCNDVVLVDPRTNQVIIGPVPGSESSRSDYAPFLLPPPTQADGQNGDVHGPEGASTVAPMGTIAGDFNEDGKQDILAYYWGRSPVVYLRNPKVPWPSGNESARDVYIAHELCLPVERWFTNTVTQADLDGDGHVDLIIGNYFPDYAHVLNSHGTGTESMQDSMSAAHNGGQNRFFLWAQPESRDEPVRFREAISQSNEVARASRAMGVAAKTDMDSPTVTFVDGSGRTLDNRAVSRILCGWTLALAAGDLDGDLYPEVYFANDFGPDRLLYNRTIKPGELRFTLLEGRRTLTTPKSKMLGHDSFKGMGVDFADINRNGMRAICVSNIASNYALEESHAVFVDQSSPGRNIQERRIAFGKLARIGVTPYQDRSEELGLSRSGWGWDWKFASFDNGLDLEGIQATGFIKGHALSTSPPLAWMTKAGLVDPAQGLVKGVRDRWPVLHELATGNDQRVSNPGNWGPMQPGDDLSGHQPNAFFVRTSNGRYYDAAEAIGLEKDVEEPMVTRGIAVADVDGDGRLDFAVANQWESSFFYHNRSPDAGYCLELRLLLPLEAGQTELEEVSSIHPGRTALGATATIHLANGETLTAQVDGGNGHSGKNAPEIHFGLGKTGQSDPVEVEIAWRDPEGKPHTLLKKHLSVGRPGHPEEQFRHTLLLPWPKKDDLYAQHFESQRR